MARLIMWNLMTLDGFIEGPNRDISWHEDVWGEELEQLSIQQLNEAGGLLFGRVTYELMAGHWPGATGEVADFMNAAPKYVFSRRWRRGVTSTCPSARSLASARGCSARAARNYGPSSWKSCARITSA